MSGQQNTLPVNSNKGFLLDEKKNRLLDTLIIITGFVFASSVSFMSTIYLYLFLLFLASCIILKSPLINEILPESLSYSASTVFFLLVSYLFPLVLISVYFVKNPIPRSDDLIWLFASLLSTSLYFSFMWNSTKDFNENVNCLFKTAERIAKPATWLMMPFIVLSLVIFFAVSSLYFGFAKTLLISIILVATMIICKSLLNKKFELLDAKFRAYSDENDLKNNKLFGLCLLSLLCIFSSLWWYFILMLIAPDIVTVYNTEYVIQSATFTMGNYSYSLENVSIKVH